MLRFFGKKVFGDREGQILETKMRGVETEWRRLGDGVRGTARDGFAGPRGHSAANLEAQRSFLRGSWRLCTPSLVYTVNCKC